MTTATRNKKTTEKFANEVRFNWGFWDAVSDARRKAARVDGLTADTIEHRHHDKSYAIGYAMGWYAAYGGWNGDNSGWAWEVAAKEGRVKEGFA